MNQWNDDEIFNALLTLESSLIELRREFASFTEATSKNLPSQGLAAITNICRVRDAIATSVMTLMPYVADADRIAGRVAVRSIDELGRRAIVSFATALLATLRELAARSPARARHLFVGKLRSMEDVSAWVLDCFSTLAPLWTIPKQPGDLVPVPPGAEHHRMLRAACVGTVAMVNDPDFVHVLRSGIAASDWPELAHACTQLAIILRLDMEAPPWAIGSRAALSSMGLNAEPSFVAGTTNVQRPRL
jgi:hypothetical protein